MVDYHLDMTHDEFIDEAVSTALSRRLKHFPDSDDSSEARAHFTEIFEQTWRESYPLLSRLTFKEWLEEDQEEADLHRD